MTGLEHELRDEVDKHNGATETLGFQAIEMESIQDELKSSEELARLIGGELEVLKVELSAPDRVRLIQEAKAPALSTRNAWSEPLEWRAAERSGRYCF